MNDQCTGAETADELIKQLVFLRHCARLTVLGIDVAHANRTEWQRRQDNAPDGPSKAAAMVELAGLDEKLLQLRSAEIEIGEYLMPLCSALDRCASRQQIFEAINTNPADRDTEFARKYAQTALKAIAVARLENSASKRGDDCNNPEFQPLQWCHTMALMRAITTSPKLDRIVHDEANEFFSGAFGEYRERPLMERLVGGPA